MAVGVAPASLMLWPTARNYIRGAGLGHAGLGRMAHSLSRGLVPEHIWYIFSKRGDNNWPAAGLDATQLRLVAPSSLAPSLFAFRPQPAACLTAYCPA